MQTVPITDIAKSSISLVLKRIAIFTFRIFDIKTNKYPIILFFNNVLKLTDYKPNIIIIDCKST